MTLKPLIGLDEIASQKSCIILHFNQWNMGLLISSPVFYVIFQKYILFLFLKIDL